MIKKDTTIEHSVDVNEYIMNNKEIYLKHTILSSDGARVIRTKKYDKCCLIEEERYLPNGNEIQKYENISGNIGKIIYSTEGKESKILEEYIRKFNSIGFLEYEEIKPYGKENGDYSVRKREILSEPDEFFNANF